MNDPALEAQALELRPDDDGRIRLSAAISLKRIADALEKANEPPLEKCELAPTAEEIAARPGARIATALENIAHSARGEDERGSMLHWLEQIARSIDAAIDR